MSDKIVEWEEYGVHIPLTCKNHPDKFWTTKNIDFIGARSIFYEGNGPECECSGRSLRPLNMEESIAYYDWRKANKGY